MYNKVWATDMAGYTSAITVSNGFCVDTMSPLPEFLLTMQENILQNPDFNDTSNAISFHDLNNTNVCQTSNSYEPAQWTVVTGSCVVLVHSGFSKAGINFVYLIGSLSQSVTLTAGLYKICFVSSHSILDAAQIANKEGFVQLGVRKHVFLIYTKSYRADDSQASTTREVISWHNHTFYFNVTEDSTLSLTIGSIDRASGFYLDDVQLQRVNKSETQEVYHSQVLGHVIFLHEWASIHGSWSFVTGEWTSILEYSWAIGIFLIY